MTHRRTSWIAATMLVVLSACTASTDDSAPAGGSTPSRGPSASRSAGAVPPPPDEATARAALGDLVVAAPHSMDGYDRDKFDIWSDQSDGCTTRQEVLKRDGKHVVDQDGDCQPESGSWYSVYDSRTVTEVSQATIDHMVPLAEAWRSGADTWTADRRREFGNDLDDPQLVVASSSSNSAKSDSGPADWKPSNKKYWCTYAEAYVGVKHKFHLTTTKAEVSAVKSMLDTC